MVGDSLPRSIQYTLTSDDTAALYSWTPRLMTELDKHRRSHGRELGPAARTACKTYLTIARATAMRYGFAPNQIDNVLYDAFGQRTVSTIFNPFNQYFVVMEVAPRYWQDPQMLERIYFSTAAGKPAGPRRLRRRAAL